MQSQMSMLLDAVQYFDSGYSKSEITNQQQRQSNGSDIIDIVFPQSHRVIDLATVQFGFSFTKAAQTDNNSTVIDFNDLFMLQEIKFNGNSLIPNTYQNSYNKFVNWMKYSVREQSVNVVMPPREQDATAKNGVILERYLVSGNSLKLLNNGEVNTDFNYRFVKLADIIPQLREIGFVSLLNGDLHIQLRVQPQQLVYGVIMSDSAQAVADQPKNVRSTEPYQLNDFQIYRRYGHLKPSLDVNTLNQMLNQPKVHFVVQQDRFSLTGSYCQHRTTLTNSSVLGVLFFISKINIAGAGNAVSSFDYSDLAKNNTGGYWPQHHSTMFQVKNAYAELGGKRHMASDMLCGQRPSAFYQATQHALSQFGWELNLPMQQFLQTRGFYFIPISVMQLDSEMVQQGSIATLVIEFDSDKPKYAITGENVNDSITSFNCDIFYIMSQTLVGSQLHKMKFQP